MKDNKELIEALEHVKAYMEKYRPASCGIDDNRACSPYNDVKEALENHSEVYGKSPRIEAIKKELK